MKTFRPQNMTLLVQQLLEEGKTIKALQVLQDTLDKHPNDIALLFEAALLQHEVGNYQEALDLYGQILTLSGKEAGAHYGRGIIYQEQDLLNDALAAYKAAVDVDSTYVQALLAQADMEDELGHAQKAEALYIHALSLGDEAYQVLTQYASFLEGQDRDQQALDQLVLALEIDQDHYLAWFNLGVVHKKLGDLMAARQAYGKAILCKPDYPYSYLNLAVMEKGAGDFDKAADILTSGIMNNPHVSVLYYNRAIMLNVLGHKSQALEDLQEACRLSPRLKAYALEDEELVGVRERLK